MKVQKFLDKMVDLVESTLVKEGVSDYFTIEDLYEDEGRVAIKLTYDYSDDEYVKDVEALYEQKREEDVKIKDLYKNSGIKSDVKAFVEEQQRLYAERREAGGDDYGLDDDFDDDYDLDDDFEDDFDDNSPEEDDSPEEAHTSNAVVFGQGTLSKPESARLSTADSALAIPFGDFYVEFLGEDGNPVAPIKGANDEDTLQKSFDVITDKYGKYAEIDRIFMAPFLDDLQLYIINGNTDSTSLNFVKNGAACIANRSFMKEFCNKIGADLLMCLPSSVHEWIVYDAKYDSAETADKCDNLVKTVNETLDDTSEILSDKAYVYDNTTGLLKEAKAYFAQKENAERS